MQLINPPRVNIVIFSVATIILMYLAGSGCAPLPPTPDPLTPVVQSIEITDAPTSITNGGAPATGTYKITLTRPARAGQSITVKIFEDDELWDERIAEDHVTFVEGTIEHTGTFEIACNSEGSMVGSTYHDENAEYEVYAGVKDGGGNTVEERVAQRIRCVPPDASP